MSTINNIPFDINRTPMDKHPIVKKTGTTPVYNSKIIQGVAKKGNSERRKGDDRRKLEEQGHADTRLLIERRENAALSSKSSESDTSLENAHKSGSIIDLEV